MHYGKDKQKSSDQFSRFLSTDTGRTKIHTKNTSQTLRKPAGGRYASILSCYTTTDTFGTGEDTIRSTYYNFSVRFDDTGETIEPFIAEMYAATLETGSRVFLVKNKRSDYDIFSADEMAVSGVHIPPLS